MKTFNDEKMMKNITCKNEQRKELKRRKIDEKDEKSELLAEMKEKKE